MSEMKSRRSCWRTRAVSTPRSSFPGSRRTTAGPRSSRYCGDVGQGDDLEAVRKKALATGASRVRRRGPARGVRARLRVQGPGRRRRLRGQLPARHRAGPAAARLRPGAGARWREGADALAHGATGKGNDQVRFEVTYGAFAPHLQRDRALARVGHPLARGRARLRGRAQRARSTRRPRDLFSRDGNLWHLSHEGGNLEDPWDAPQQGDVQAHRRPRGRARTSREVVTIALRARACRCRVERRSASGRWRSSRR